MSLHTSLPDHLEIDSDLEREFASRSLAIVATPELLQLPGPVSVKHFVHPADAGSGTQISLAVLTEVGFDAFELASAAVEAAHPELRSGASSTMTSVLELVDGPNATIAIENCRLHAVLEGEAAIGVVLQRIERRSASGAERAAVINDPSAGNGSHGYNPAPGLPGTGFDRASAGLMTLKDVVLDVSVELGREFLTVAQMLSLSIGSIVELDRPAGSPVDIRVNGILFARGEVVVVDDVYAVRLLELLGTPESTS